MPINTRSQRCLLNTQEGSKFIYNFGCLALRQHALLLCSAQETFGIRGTFPVKEPKSL